MQKSKIKITNQNQKIIFSFLYLFFIFSILFLNLSVANAGLVPCGGTGQDPCTVCDLFVGINGIIKFLLQSVAFPLAIVALLYGGIMMIIAGGDEGKITKGKKAIEYAIYGILLAFAAWIIVNTILTSLVQNKTVWPFSQDWTTIPQCPKQ